MSVQSPLRGSALRRFRCSVPCLNGCDANGWRNSYFGPNQAPLLQVGFRGLVDVDAGSTAVLTSLSDYEKTVDECTWRAVMKYAADMKERNVKVAFFSSTPQGGGVALMRHALVRFSHALGTNIKWLV